MHYLAALDFDHLDNGVFLTSFAQSLSQHQDHKDIRSIIIHSDSAYTERIMQTGVMRSEASIRSTKDLNKRLVALFADQGVSTVGINPYKRDFITLKDGNLTINHSFLEGLPKRSVLLLSSLVLNVKEGQPVKVELSRLAAFLMEELDIDECFIFSKSDRAEILTDTGYPDEVQWNEMDDEFRDEQIPDDLEELPFPVRLTSGRDFGQIPDLSSTIHIPSAEK